MLAFHTVSYLNHLLYIILIRVAVHESQFLVALHPVQPVFSNIYLNYRKS
jgi:hypothetical protein